MPSLSGGARFPVAAQGSICTFLGHRPSVSRDILVEATEVVACGDSSPVNSVQPLTAAAGAPTLFAKAGNGRSISQGIRSPPGFPSTDNATHATDAVMSATGRKVFSQDPIIHARSSDLFPIPGHRAAAQQNPKAFNCGTVRS